MTDTLLAKPNPIGRRESRKAEALARIHDELVKLISEGTDINHDIVAERADVSRRTLYRYFPDRDALLESLWDHVGKQAGTNVHPPSTEGELLSGLPEIHLAFDRMAALFTVIASTPQGRAIRLAGRAKRKEKYESALADAVSGLPPRDRKLAVGIIQMLHTGGWLELRDNWGLDGKETARAVGWAIRTLLADLHARKNEALDQIVNAPVVLHP